MAGLRRMQASVGLMVVAGLVLLIGFVLFVTRESYTRGGTVFETYFRESVQGLEVGSPVRYRGVAVGRVSEISLASAQYRRPRGEAFAGAFQLVVVRFSVELRQTGDIPGIAEAVGQGLRARLASTGITGVIYIELDFLDPERFPVQSLPWQPASTFIPAVPSTTSQVQTAAETLLRRLEEVDLNGLLDNVTGLIADTRALVRSPGIATTLSEVAELVKEVRMIATQADVPGAVAELRGTASAARGVIEGREVREVLSQSARAMADLRRATAQLPAAVVQLEAVLRSARGTTTDLQADLAPVLRDLRATTSNLRDTSEALRRSPGQAIFGAPPPPRAGR